MRMLTKTAIAAASFAWVGAAHAVPITGSLAFADGANENGSLVTRTSFTVNNATTQGSTNNFSSVALNVPVTIGTFTIPTGPAPTATASPSDFKASFTGGTFAATSAQKTDQFVAAGTGNESITLLFLGTFTPANGLSAFDPSPASVIANLNRSGSLGNFSVSSAFTLAAPPANTPPVTPVPPPVTPVPEPMSIALLGMGLVGAGMLRRRAK